MQSVDDVSSTLQEVQQLLDEASKKLATIAHHPALQVGQHDGPPGHEDDPPPSQLAEKVRDITAEVQGVERYLETYALVLTTHREAPKQ